MALELIAFFIAIIANSCFSIMAAQYKVLRNQGVSARLVTAISGVTVPVWFTGLLVATVYYNFNPSREVIFFVASWAVLCSISKWIKVYLIRFQSLSELNAISKSMLFISLMLSDFIFFSTDIDYFIITGAGMLFCASMIFAKERIVFDAANIFKGSYLKMLLMVFVMCLIVSAQLILYKKAVIQTDNTLFFVFLAASIMHFLRFMMAPREIPQKLAERNPAFIKPVIIIAVLLIIGASLEAFAYKNLPLILVHMSAVVPAIVYGFFDYRNGEVQMTLRTKIAFAITLLAICLVAVGKAYF